MPIDPMHDAVATHALAAAAGHGFVLAGGNALIAHGIIDRKTADVDLFTDQPGGVAAAAQAVEDQLRLAGFRVTRQDKTGGLADIFPGMGEGLAEWVVRLGSHTMMLQMAYFERHGEPLVMAIGPVLSLQDTLACKVVALAARSEPRDFIDVAAALEHFTPEQLIGWARQQDHGLAAHEFADAGERLDRLADAVLVRLGLGPSAIARLRGRFARWPRPARQR